MKPAPFSYVRPGSIEEAVDALASSEARVLAGGQSLIPLLNMRRVTPSHLVDIGAIDELRGHTVKDGRVTVSAGVTQRTIETDPALSVDVVAEAAASVASVPVRNRGTVVGSIAHAEAAGEWPALLMLLEGTCVVRSHRGERRLSAQDFFVGRSTTALAPDELITAAEFGLPAPGDGSAWVELSRRPGDFPIVGCGAFVALDDNASVDRCKVVVGGVAPTPIRSSAVERAVVGRGRADVGGAAHEVLTEIDPADDAHATAWFRTRVVVEIVERALSRAFDRAKKQTS